MQRDSRQRSLSGAPWRASTQPARRRDQCEPRHGQSSRARPADLHLRPRPAAVRAGVGGGGAARRTGSRCVSRSARSSGWTRTLVAASDAVGVLPADAHGDTAGDAGRSIGSARSIRGRGCARTVSMHRSMPRCSVSMGSSTSSAASSRTISCEAVRRRTPAVERAVAATADDRRSAAGGATRHVPGARSRRAAAAVAVRLASARRAAARRRLHRGQPRLQAPLPALSDRPGLRRPVPHRPARHRARGHPRAGGRRGAAHHVRRSRFLQRPPPRARSWSAPSRASSRASPTTSRSRSSTCSRTPAMLPLLRDTGCAVRDLRRRIDRRSGAGAAREGAHARRVRTGRRAVPRGGADARADVRRVHAVDDARRVLRAAADDRCARSRGPRGAGPAGDPAADSRRIAPAGARRGAGDRRAVFDRLADLSVAARRSREVDALQRRLEAMVGSAARCPIAQELFSRVWEAAHAAAGRPR